MGYTHYFPSTRDFTKDEWSNLCEATHVVFKYCEKQGIFLEVNADNDHIMFNGIDDHAYEDFFISRKTDNKFNCCKTANKPYDFAVMLVLLAANKVAPGALKISSDGKWDVEWLKARNAFEVLFGVEAVLEFEH
jgi:hypothetical protein